MVSVKIVAWSQIVLGILVLLVPLIAQQFYFMPMQMEMMVVPYVVWVEVVLGIVVLVVGALALKTK